MRDRSDIIFNDNIDNFRGNQYPCRDGENQIIAERPLNRRRSRPLNESLTEFTELAEEVVGSGETAELVA